MSLARFTSVPTTICRWRPFSPRAALAVATLTLAAVGDAGAQTDYYNTGAGRPITIEDASAVERRAVELQLAPLRLERPRGGGYHWGIEPEVAAGILPRTQLEVGLPFAIVDAGTTRTSGLAGVELSVVLNPNDNTSTFKADATFYKVAGLADATWSSFRSYNFPSMYLRHANFVLRIDPISTTLEKQDATFNVVR